jgi:sodium-coupled neutral amino acid transporter 11
VRYPTCPRRVCELTLDLSCFGLNMLTTLPLEAFVCRSVMTTYYFPDESFNMNRHLIFTSALVLTSVAMALLTCDLGAVFELIGATSAASLAYIFPPLCYIKLSNASRKEKIPAYLCIAFGVTVMGVSLLQAVGKMINSMCSPLSLYSLGAAC